MNYYFAVFMPERTGGYSIWFPDFPEANTQGGDLQEGMEMAADVLAITAEEYARARRPLPDPSPLETVRTRAAEALRESGVQPAGEIIYPLVAAPDLDMTTVKVNISLPKHALATLDAKAKMQGMTRSGFIVRAVQAYQG